jgi:hypothetical protein
MAAGAETRDKSRRELAQMRFGDEQRQKRLCVKRFREGFPAPAANESNGLHICTASGALGDWLEVIARRGATCPSEAARMVDGGLVSNVRAMMKRRGDVASRAY